MAISVANPKPTQTISGVSYAQPSSTISGVTSARPGTISGVVNATPPQLSSAQQFIQRAQQTLASPPPAPPLLPSALAVVRPPTLNYAALQAKARSDAEGAVNPYYTKQLNDFLAEQGAKRQQQQTMYETGVKNLEDQLSQTLDANKTTGQRTTEDVATNQADINQAADTFQTDTGQAADAARINEARQLAQSGLSGGLGAQQQEATQTQRNTAEKRQEQDFQKQRTQQELFKTRTFEDLANSGELATKATEKGKTAAKFDLDSFIQNQGFEAESKKSTLEAARLGAVASEQQNRAKIAYSQYLAGIRDPAALQAAAQIYGSAF